LDGWKKILKDSDRISKYRTYVTEHEKEVGAFLEFDPERISAIEVADELAGVPFAVKDNIAVKGYQLTCGSKILEGVRSPYTATAVEMLQRSGAVPVGKTNLDEFGMGSSTDDSALGSTSNPWDNDRVAGGSSGGSAAAVAAGMVPFALGSDTGGSIRQPAAFCGVYGLKPTYGTVSRYGLVAYASSLEVIGVVSRHPGICRTVFERMRGLDPRDQSSVEYRSRDDEKSCVEGSGKEKPTIGYLSGLEDLDPPVASGYAQTVERLREIGYEMVEVTLPTLEYVVPSYYTIATAEASANLARFNGIRYGYRPEWAENPEELIRKARTEGFGEEVKLRILLGTFVLRSGFQDQYYVKAQKIRTAIRNDFDSVFSRVGLVLMPVFPTLAFPHGADGLSHFQQRLADKFTATANLAGIPAISFPCGLSEGLPVGMQFLAPVFEEERLFRVTEAWEDAYPAPMPTGKTPEWSE